MISCIFLSLRSTDYIPVLEGKDTQHHTYNHFQNNRFQLTRLEKVSMPSSCVRRLDRNTPPLRDKSTPARAWSSSDLICFNKSHSYNCKITFYHEKMLNSEASESTLATSAVSCCRATEPSALRIWAVTDRCTKNARETLSNNSQDMVGARTKYPKTKTRYQLDQVVQENPLEIQEKVVKFCKSK